MELVELFGVTAPTLRTAIKAIYKNRALCPVNTQRCDLATPKSWATFYNLEMVIALAFRLNTYEASRIRQKVLESLCIGMRICLRQQSLTMELLTSFINQALMYIRKLSDLIL